MDEENVQQTPNPNSNGNGGITKVVDWAKSHVKQIAIIVIAVVVIFAAFTLIKTLIGGPEQAVKNYVSALSTCNGKKIANAMDFQGAIAYEKCTNYFEGLDESKFEEEYKNVDKDDAKEERENLIDNFDEVDQDELKDRAFKLKVVDIKDVTESDDCDKLYEVEAKIRTTYKDEDGDKQDNTSTFTFYVYKNKVIYSNMSALSLTSLF